MRKPIIHPFVRRLSALISAAALVIPATAKTTTQALESKPGTIPALPGVSASGFLAGSRDVLIAAAAPAMADEAGRLAVWSCAPASPAGPAWVDSGIRVPSWSAAARWDRRVVVAGGMLNGSPVKEVQLLSDEGSGRITAKRLPDLPHPLAGASAAMIGSTLHVVGGVSSVNPPVIVNHHWKLDLAGDPAAASWQEAEALPGAPRAFAATTQQYGMLCLFGGIVQSAAPDNRLSLTNETWIFRASPIEGTSYVGWKRGNDVPFSAAAAAALPVGQAGVVLAGGSRDGAAVSIPPAGNDINSAPPPWLYHTITDAWCAFNRGLPMSGALATAMDPEIILVGREGSATFTFPRTIRKLALIDYLVVIAYFGILAGIGFYFSKQESSDEFSLGNRKVKWWAAGISMFATGASAISFMAIPALAFATNLVWTLPVVATLIPAYFITSRVIFPLLRRMEITSTYEYLDRRFNHPLRLIASAQCILIQTIGRTSVVLVLPALAISSVTGMDVYLSVILMGVLTTIYTAVGGFESVIWTEVFQGILKFIAPLAMVVIAIVSLPGGFGGFWKTSAEYGKLESAILSWDLTVPALWILLVSYLLQFTVMKAGDQPIIQRVFSAPLHEVRRVSAMETTCAILIGILSNVLGIAIFAYFKAHPEQFSPTAQNDQIVPVFVTQAMPPGFAGMVIAAIFASAMATVASAMNSVATIYTEDFYPHFRRNPTDKQRLRTLKIASYAVGFIGTAMALLLAATNPKSLMVVWSQIVSLMGGGIVGVYSLGMFTTRVNGFGAVCGAIASIVITLLVKLYTPLHWASYLPIAIVSCMVCGYLFSLFSPQRKNLEGLTVFTPKNPASPTP